MKIFQHITKSGKKSPYWIVDLGVEQIKVVGKKMATKLMGLYKDGTDNVRSSDDFSRSTSSSTVSKGGDVLQSIQVRFQHEECDIPSIGQFANDSNFAGTCSDDSSVVDSEDRGIPIFYQYSEGSGSSSNSITVRAETNDLLPDVQSQLRKFHEGMVVGFQELGTIFFQCIDGWNQTIDDWRDTIDAWGDTIDAWGETIDDWGKTITVLQDLCAEIRRFNETLGFDVQIDPLDDEYYDPRTTTQDCHEPFVERFVENDGTIHDKFGRKIIFQI